MPSAKDLDAVTVDAMGTVVELDEPVERLGAALRQHGIERDPATVASAFEAEIAYYLAKKLRAGDEESLAALRRECSRVFLEGAKTEIDPGAFTPSFVEAIAFRPLDGSIRALERLRGAGLVLACVSDWDVGLRDALAESGLGHLFAIVVTSAEAGAEKPSPAIFLEALARLGVERRRALHIGDGDADRKGAAAAGLPFEPVPLATLPERLGVR
jgi:putative hydrolase of the HAD superfamily